MACIAERPADTVAAPGNDSAVCVGLLRLNITTSRPNPLAFQLSNSLILSSSFFYTLELDYSRHFSLPFSAWQPVNLANMSWSGKGTRSPYLRHVVTNLYCS